MQKLFYFFTVFFCAFLFCAERPAWEDDDVCKCDLARYSWHKESYTDEERYREPKKSCMGTASFYINLVVQFFVGGLPAAWTWLALSGRNLLFVLWNVHADRKECHHPHVALLATDDIWRAATIVAACTWVDVMYKFFRHHERSKALAGIKADERAIQKVARAHNICFFSRCPGHNRAGRPCDQEYLCLDEDNHRTANGETIFRTMRWACAIQGGKRRLRPGHIMQGRGLFRLTVRRNTCEFCKKIMLASHRVFRPDL